MLVETIKTIDLHLRRADAAKKEIMLFKDNLTTDTFNDFEKIKSIDTFIFRFTKVQDLLGEKLFKEVLISLGDYKDNMTMLDIQDKLEKIEIIEHASEWMDFRNLRNILAHEYPDNEEDLLDGIIMSLEVHEKIKVIYKNIKELLTKKNLI